MKTKEKTAVVMRTLLEVVRGDEPIGMPHSRPMPSIGSGCHDQRVRVKQHNWRAVYRIDGDAIVVAEIFRKTIQQTPKPTIDLCRARLAAFERMSAEAEKSRSKKGKGGKRPAVGALGLTHEDAGVNRDEAARLRRDATGPSRSFDRWKRTPMTPSHFRTEVTMLGLIARLGLIACVWSGTWAGTAGAQEPAGTREVRYREGREAFANPDRGFYAASMSHRVSRLEGLRGRGITLLLVEMDLRDFKDREIGPEKLAELRQAFSRARENGLKVIFRAAYGFTGRDYRADPADLGRIRGHIRQLGAIFRADRDVLFAVQAGFLGPWGEWHGSNHGDPPSLEARRAVLSGLLEAVPAPISVQIRRPMFIRDLFAGEPALTVETAWTGTPLSRTGWHDDALLSLPTDMGTYAEQGWDRERELGWCEVHGRFTPFGGETVPDSAKTPIGQVVGELERLHATYLNSSYHRGTLEGWRKAEHLGENAFAYIERRLGYRLVADRLRLPSSVAPGETLRVDLELKNVGFAAPVLPREVAFVLSRGEARYRAVAPADPRRWGPGGAIRVGCELRLPPDAARGTWTLSLHLADPSPGLRDDGRYAIRLANEDVRFVEQSGWNVLAEDVEVR
jgi:phage-related protein